MQTSRAELVVLSFVSAAMIALVTCCAVSCNGAPEGRTVAVGVGH